MKTTACLLLIGLACAAPGLTFAQQPNTCSAAFVGNRMLVDQYTTTGRCRLSAKTTGELTVRTVALSPTATRAIDKIGFKVAIRDKSTGTLRMYAGHTFQKLPLQRVLASCRKGDRIVLLTVDNRYALPHNEILVQ
ncbi:hypothetical protein [Spirosoma sordidisoli]|uniref:Uncharacterized protein n=1 Tax=Spirosoma sordidisoli TaxID=2502893 RepID=A0A4Q2UM81_9BACT|nr:hypothetical protein [Spirosoma sordidisoli]RYC68831.1 hypothetical protein EQG79_15545 [Spirosoma sordidisoli]